MALGHMHPPWTSFCAAFGDESAAVRFHDTKLEMQSNGHILDRPAAGFNIAKLLADDKESLTLYKVLLCLKINLIVFGFN
jgi:hypothetical protein